MRFGSRGGFHFIALAALAIAPAALATSTVTTFLDPPEDFVPTLPVAVSAATYGERWDPCESADFDDAISGWICTRDVKLIESTPETAEISYVAVGDDGWAGELREYDDLLSIYLEGLAIYFVESDGTVKEILSIFLESADSQDLGITYRNSLPGEDFGKVPDDALRVGRNHQFTLIGLDISIEGKPQILFADQLTPLVKGSGCGLCVVVRRVPEPTSLALLGLGLAGLGGLGVLGRRRKTA